MRDIGYKIPVVSIVDDDESVRDALKGFIQSIGFKAEIFASAEDFLVSDMLDRTTCMIVDVHMPVMTGLELQCRLATSRCPIHIILITAQVDPAMWDHDLYVSAIGYLRNWMY